ncbi:MAG: hypothetical protein HY701_00780 [Gemmatimonadetes bacterium]|nr:hypothetical protein [Gemmatimonadota bacterium]
MVAHGLNAIEDILTAPVLRARRARALIDQVWTLDSVKDLRELRPLLQAPTPTAA